MTLQDLTELYEYFHAHRPQIHNALLRDRETLSKSAAENASVLYQLAQKEVDRGIDAPPRPLGEILVEAHEMLTARHISIPFIPPVK